ncbi:MAG: hypothetical protein R3F30_08110 [Planctomycetota bacterium]
MKLIATMLALIALSGSGRAQIRFERLRGLGEVQIVTWTGELFGQLAWGDLDGDGYPDTGGVPFGSPFKDGTVPMAVVLLNDGKRPVDPTPASRRRSASAGYGLRSLPARRPSPWA